MKKTYLGEFEQLVLLALLRLGDNAYGMTVREELSQTAGRSTSLGAVYTTLERREDKGLVKSRIADPSPARGGRPKKFFRIQASGAAALKENIRFAELMKAGLEPILGSSR